MILYDAEQYEQYSEEWWAIRLGIPTASRASEIITAARGSLSASSKPYISELIAERLGLDTPSDVNTGWMQRGSELEDEALRFFTFETGLAVSQVGFITNEDGTAGCSPDSLIDDGAAKDMPHFVAGLEIKCPMAKTHISYLIDGTLPDIYKQQVHFSLAVTQLPFWYWMSYHPELDPLIVTVERDDYTAKVEKALDQFVINQCEAMQKLGIS
jgi:hypothetical protein